MDVIGETSVSLALVPGITIAMAVYLIFDRKIYYWTKELPWPNCISNYYYLITSWALLSMLYGLQFSLTAILKSVLKITSMTEIILTVINLFNFLLYYSWPVFLYKYKDIRMSNLIIFNQTIYLLVSLLTIIILWVNNGDLIHIIKDINVDKHSYSKLSLFFIQIILWIVCFVNNIFLLINHKYLLDNLYNQEI